MHYDQSIADQGVHTGKYERTIRHHARVCGLRWAEVLAAYQEIKEEEQVRRERPNEIRQAAWIMATASTPGSWPFWRHGFLSRWGRRVELSDYTAIPGYDEIGQQIGTLFPEYNHAQGTEELFAMLLSPYDRMPTKNEILRRAVDRVYLRQSKMKKLKAEAETCIPF